MSDITADDAEAAERYEQWKVVDPFPTIAPALLNSGDVRDYVAATGLLCPFRDDRDWLKPASYEVPLLGDAVYWEGDGTKFAQVIDDGTPFILRPNSIAFVTLEPMIRLPAYIAVRFNLKITNVYRGLLLGTGPLIDPGFTGRLSLPLHNLTSNSYTFVGGEGLIWMEFTKLSPDRLAVTLPEDAIPREGEVVELPERKRHVPDVHHYLRKADLHRPIRSSIPISLEAATAAATEAGAAAERSASSVRTLTISITIIGVITVATVIFQIYSLVSDVNARIDNLPAAPIGDRRRIADLERTVADLQRQLDVLEGQRTQTGTQAN